jgi:hydrogenase maturation factor
MGESMISDHNILIILLSIYFISSIANIICGIAGFERRKEKYGTPEIVTGFIILIVLLLIFLL